MPNTHLLCVENIAGNGLFYSCAQITGSGTGLNWNVTRKQMYRSSKAGPALALFNDTIWCVYVVDGGDKDGVVCCTTWNSTERKWNADVEIGAMSDRTPTLAVLGDTLFCIHRGYNDQQLYWHTNN